MKDPIEHLGRIGRVAPPPFLLTRIDARIAAQLNEHVPIGKAVAIFCGLALLLVVNTWALRSNGPSAEKAMPSATALGSSLDLNPSNQLYHE